MNITANYEHILHLGVKDISTIAHLRPSGVLEFAELHRLWLPLEKACGERGYDVFEAWKFIAILAIKLRFNLMWLTAMCGSAGRGFPAFGPDKNELSEVLVEVARMDMSVLMEKNASYGESWKRRGGIGAFMMLARKFDRIENILKEFSGASFIRQIRNNPGQVQDDISDLRRYLLLVEDEMHSRGEVDLTGEATKAYVAQD